MQHTSYVAVVRETQLRLLLGIPRLEVGLPVKIDGLDVREASGVTSGEQYHVGGERLVGRDAYDVPDAYVLPFLGEVLAGGLWREDGGEAVVLPAVGAVAADVLVGVLHSGDEEHEGQREHRRATAKDGDLGELVEHGDGEEVDVRQPSELLEQVARQEGERGVLGRPDSVAGKLRRGLPHSDGAVLTPLVELPLRRGRVGLVAAGGAEGARDLNGEAQVVSANGRLRLRRRELRRRRRRVRGGDVDERALGRHGGGGENYWVV